MALSRVMYKLEEKMFFRACGLVAAVVLLFNPHTASGAGTVSIQYSVVPLGGNVYRYVYTITNNGSLPGGAPIKLFDIVFDHNLYQVGSVLPVTYLVNNSLASQWTEQVLNGLPSVEPYYDVFSVSGAGIPAGSSVSGFAVQFTYLGAGIPGPQPFRIYDPTQTPFQLTQSGSTFSPASVPLASNVSLILIGIGLAIVAAYQVRRRRPRTTDGCC
jgi:hypothetical protein